MHHSRSLMGLSIILKSLGNLVRSSIC
uniref:Uncharacterized protein n=1 Tax=Rhizophora mucronata TaxID=61149 RepID=A0A2P2IN88_RHIMU